MYILQDKKENEKLRYGKGNKRNKIYSVIMST
jgi:hypothetical protein